MFGMARRKGKGRWKILLRMVNTADGGGRTIFSLDEQVRRNKVRKLFSHVCDKVVGASITSRFALKGIATAEKIGEWVNR